MNKIGVMARSQDRIFKRVFVVTAGLEGKKGTPKPYMNADEELIGKAQWGSYETFQKLPGELCHGTRQKAGQTLLIDLQIEVWDQESREGAAGSINDQWSVGRLTGAQRKLDLVYHYLCILD